MRTRLKLGGADWFEYEAPTLGSLRCVAEVFGWTVDVEPMEPGKVVVRATGANRSLSFTGTSVHEACHKMILALAGR